MTVKELKELIADWPDDEYVLMRWAIDPRPYTFWELEEHEIRHSTNEVEYE